jgi:tetratricopeptide (TPR) repeat protein
MTLYNLERYGEAEKELRAALELDCDTFVSSSSHYYLGLILWKGNKLEEAVQELEKAAQEDPSFADPHFFLGKCYEALEKQSAARKSWKRYLEIAPDGPLAAEAKAAAGETTRPAASTEKVEKIEKVEKVPSKKSQTAGKIPAN